MDQQTKKEMAEKLSEEKFYTEDEMQKRMYEMRRNMEIEIERARISEKIYRELLFKVLKIEDDKDKIRFPHPYLRDDGESL